VGMHAYGRTLRREGDLTLLALPATAGCEWYCVCNGPTPLGTFTLLSRAMSFFAAVSGARPAGSGGSGRADRRPPARPGEVTDLAAYRQRRGRRSPGAPHGDGAAVRSEEG
jgi:hypothetical protein